MSGNFYQEHPEFIRRTDNDMKLLNLFDEYSKTVNYGPNPVPNEPLSSFDQNYKSLYKAYNPVIMNDCMNRWDNDYMRWEQKINKSGKGLK